MAVDRTSKTSDRRHDPDQLLRWVDAQERQLSHERLKIFLGYASGVGKSFRMLDEGRRRRERGQDVVVGAVQPNLPPELDRLIQTMEVIPLKKAGSSGSMDVDRIIERRPQVCLVDGAAYDNPPGGRNPKRWQDIMELVHRGIVVITSLNLQHIEERREVVKRITSKQVLETVPESFLYEANEIVIVDVPPELLLERAGGPDAANPELAETRRPLSELRELALLLTAEAVDRQLEDYLLAHGIGQRWGTQERTLVYLTPDSNAEAMIASGKRNANRFHGEFHALYVRRPQSPGKEDADLQNRLERAKQAGAQVAVLESDNPMEEIMDFARRHGITQIFLENRRGKHWWDRWTGRPIDRLIRAAEGIDVRVFPR